VRISVFPDQPGHVQELGSVGWNLNPDLVPEPVKLLPPALLTGLHLPRDEVLEKATSALPYLFSAEIQALEELVRNGDHHLGHKMSIYGIARRQNGHGPSVKGGDARVARRLQNFRAECGTKL
jgi:hypothetical protein